MENLTHDDVTLLCEAIVAWESEPAKNNTSDMILTSFIGQMAGMPKEEINRRIKESSTKAKCEERRRSDAACQLRAKLIAIRQQLESEAADRILSDAAKVAAGRFS